MWVSASRLQRFLSFLRDGICIYIGRGAVEWVYMLRPTRRSAAGVCVCVCVCVCVRIFIFIYIYIYIYATTQYIYVYIYIYIYISMSICLSIYLSIYLYIYISDDRLQEILFRSLLLLLWVSFAGDTHSGSDQQV